MCGLYATFSSVGLHVTTSRRIADGCYVAVVHAEQVFAVPVMLPQCYEIWH